VNRLRALFLITVGRGLIFALGAGVGVVALVLISFAFWKGMADAMMKMLEQIPPEMKAFMGGREAQLTSLTGYLGALFQHPIPMALLSFSAIGSAGRAIAGEVESGTSDLLYARPISRGAVLAAHVAGAVARIAVIVAFYPLGIAISATVTGQWDQIAFDRCIATSVVLFALFVCVFGYALVASALARTAGAVYGASGTLTVVFFLLSLLGDVKEAWEPVKRFTPFGYFRTAALLNGGREPWSDALLLVGAGFVCIGAAWVILRRRDL
jgi:ABC-type transport system involved in multi-copper enzyme maturation permease subunit